MNFSSHSLFGFLVVVFAVVVGVVTITPPPPAPLCSTMLPFSLSLSYTVSYITDVSLRVGFRMISLSSRLLFSHVSSNFYRYRKNKKKMMKWKVFFRALLKVVVARRREMRKLCFNWKKHNRKQQLHLSHNGAHIHRLSWLQNAHYSPVWFISMPYGNSMLFQQFSPASRIVKWLSLLPIAMPTKHSYESTTSTRFVYV